MRAILLGVEGSFMCINCTVIAFLPVQKLHTLIYIYQPSS